MPLILDHSIVAASLLTNFTINKDREWAACRICGAIFQSVLNSNSVSAVEYYSNPDIPIAAHIETMEWREKHNKTHSTKEHDAFSASGLTLSPEAAHKLAPFGIAPVADALVNQEVADAMGTAPRAPTDNPETALKPTVSLSKGITVPEVSIASEVETPEPTTVTVEIPPDQPNPVPDPEPEPDAPEDRVIVGTPEEDVPSSSLPNPNEEGQ